MHTFDNKLCEGRAWEMGNTPTLWETESSSNGALDCVGEVLQFSGLF